MTLFPRDRRGHRVELRRELRLHDVHADAQHDDVAATLEKDAGDLAAVHLDIVRPLQSCVHPRHGDERLGDGDGAREREQGQPRGGQRGTQDHGQKQARSRGVVPHAAAPTAAACLRFGHHRRAVRGVVCGQARRVDLGRVYRRQSHDRRCHRGDRLSRPANRDWRSASRAALPAPRASRAPFRRSRRGRARRSPVARVSSS